MVTREEPDKRVPRPNGAGDVDDLGTQLEDLVVHVLECERWARMDDRIALLVDVERVRRPRRSP